MHLAFQQDHQHPQEGHRRAIGPHNGLRDLRTQQQQDHPQLHPRLRAVVESARPVQRRAPKIHLQARGQVVRSAAGESAVALGRDLDQHRPAQLRELHEEAADVQHNGDPAGYKFRDSVRAEQAADVKKRRPRPVHPDFGDNQRGERGDRTYLMRDVEVIRRLTTFEKDYT